VQGLCKILASNQQKSGLQPAAMPTKPAPLHDEFTIPRPAFAMVCLELAQVIGRFKPRL
jgi:hypothetical protein